MSNSSLIQNITNCTENVEVTLKHHLYYVNGIIVPTCCFVGIVLNLLNVAVFTRPSFRRSSLHIFFIALAISDIVILLVSGIYYVRFATFENGLVQKSDLVSNPQSYHILWHCYFSIWYMIANVFLTCSLYITLTVGIFRFLAVYFPMKKSHWCSHNRARGAVVGIFCFGVFTNIPEFITMQSHPERCVDFSPYFFDEEFSGYLHLVRAILCEVAPAVISILISISLLVRLRRHSITSRALTASGGIRRSRRLNRMNTTMVSINFILFVCLLPSVVHDVIGWISTNNLTCYIDGVIRSGGIALSSSLTSAQYYQLRLYGQLFLIINFSSTFYIYMIVNAQFRRVLCRYNCWVPSLQSGNPRTGAPDPLDVLLEPPPTMMLPKNGLRWSTSSDQVMKQRTTTTRTGSSSLKESTSTGKLSNGAAKLVTKTMVEKLEHLMENTETSDDTQIPRDAEYLPRRSDYMRRILSDIMRQAPLAAPESTTSSYSNRNFS